MSQQKQRNSVIGVLMHCMQQRACMALVLWLTERNKMMMCQQANTTLCSTC
jgi:hypothetical protein